LKTLYISDLDGTLLSRDAEISEFTANTLNRLIENGMHFSIATARTYSTAVKILNKVNIQLPIIMMNGVVIFDLFKNKYLNTEKLDNQMAKEVIHLLKKHQIGGLMYTIKDDIMSTYFDNISTPYMREFMEHRQTQFGKVFIKSDSLLYECRDDTVYFSVLDIKEKLECALMDLKQIDGIHVEFYRDVYSDNMWEEELWFLEICDAKASKKSAVHYLREHYGFDQVVSFGDNLNDLPMFEESDESYAVANARVEVKSKATGCIESNVDDGVAKWLKKNGSITFIVGLINYSF